MSKRPHRLHVRCSAEELGEIDAHARDYGLTRSEYVRTAALRVLDDDPMIVIEKPAELVELPTAPSRRFERIRRLLRRRSP